MRPQTTDPCKGITGNRIIQRRTFGQKENTCQAKKQTKVRKTSIFRLLTSIAMAV